MDNILPILMLGCNIVFSLYLIFRNSSKDTHDKLDKIFSKLNCNEIRLTRIEDKCNMHDNEIKELKKTLRA
jgi:chaperonin cofactor prefoldin